MKKGKKVKTVPTLACTKTECKKAPASCSKEENLKKLAKSGKIGNFVTKNKGCWDHQAWLMFCGEIVEAGYEPIDFDQVGLMLEKEKADFLHQF